VEIFPPTFKQRPYLWLAPDGAESLMHGCPHVDFLGHLLLTISRILFGLLRDRSLEFFSDSREK
jgi:hypothetical protein